MAGQPINVTPLQNRVRTGLDAAKQKTQPSLLTRALRFAVQKNFLYLLSAFFVLVGCWQVMNDGQGEGASQLTRTLLLLGILQVYEVVLVLVGYAVHGRLRLDHDGLMLALISIGLLLDPTFFNNRVYATADGLLTGLLCNAVLLALAAFKLFVMVEVSQIPLTRRFVAALAGTAAFVFLAPAVAHAIPPGSTLTMVLFAMLFAVPALALWLPRPRGFQDGEAPDRPWTELHGRFERYAFFIPLVVLPLHLYELSLIYGVENLLALAAPGLLAAGILLMKLDSDLGRSPAVLAALAWSACLAAELAFNGSWVQAHLGLVTPLRVTLLAAAGFLTLVWSHTDSSPALEQACAMVTLAAAGGHLAAIGRSLAALEPGWLAVTLLYLALFSLFRGHLDEIVATGACASLLAARLLGLDGAWSFYVGVQLTGLWTLAACWRCRPEGITPAVGVTVTAAMLGTTAVYLADFPGAAAWLTWVLHGQITACLGLRLAGVRWAGPAGYVGALRYQAWPLVARGNLSALAGYGGHASLVAAFLLLALGFWVSVNKTSLLARLTDETAGE